MIDITPDNCHLYIERFLDGETSLAEEQALYRLYASGRMLPPEAEALRSMMEWYASLAPAGRHHPREPRVLDILRWAGIAALFAIVFTAAIILPANATKASALPEDYAMYEGSYIVRDGDTIRDLSIVIPEIDRIEAEIDRRIAESELNGRRYVLFTEPDIYTNPL